MKTFRLLANHTSTSSLVPALYCHHPLTTWDIHQSHCWISQPFSQSDCAPHWVLHGPANADQQVQHLLPSRSARKGHQHLHPAAATSSPVHLKRRHPRDTGSHLLFHGHWTCAALQQSIQCMKVWQPEYSLSFTISICYCIWFSWFDLKRSPQTSHVYVLNKIYRKKCNYCTTYHPFDKAALCQ